MLRNLSYSILQPALYTVLDLGNKPTTITASNLMLTIFESMGYLIYFYFFSNMKSPKNMTKRLIQAAVLIDDTRQVHHYLPLQVRQETPVQRTSRITPAVTRWKCNVYVLRMVVTAEVDTAMTKEYSEMAI